ncbi:hypothetical protein PGTUg99_021782 [Puccinia graminis f. sp. tritici]|uniref:Uncharacterized protein n=1 Tax=Puccinia graminis f. sp. tritici TaxID=56615 RepID=A0A5B0LSB9_PUCGR|nr:hypothetical protein PGTUg99_021782 [Puccinia graminis f. sp. tritici]
MPKRRQVTFAKSQPTRYKKRPEYDEEPSASEDHDSESQDTSQSEDVSRSEDTSQTEDSSTSQIDGRRTTKHRPPGKGKAKAEPARRRHGRHMSKNIVKSPPKPPRLKSALAVKSVTKIPARRTRTTRAIAIESDETSDDVYRYHTRSGRRPPTPSAPAALDDLAYAEEGRQDPNSYPRPKISPFLQLPPDSTRSEQLPKLAFNPYNPCPKRRRYVQLQDGNQTYAIPGYDHDHRDKDASRESRFTPASIPFGPTPVGAPSGSNPSQQDFARYSQSGVQTKPSYGYEPIYSNAQTKVTPLYGYESSSAPHTPQLNAASQSQYSTSQSQHPTLQPQHSDQPHSIQPNYGYQQPSLGSNTSQAFRAPTLGYQPSSTHFDYLPQRFIDHTYTPEISGPTPAVPSGPKPFDYSQYWNTKPTPSKNESTEKSPSISQASVIPSQKNLGTNSQLGFNFSCPSGRQEKPPLPPPSRPSQSGAQEKVPPPPSSQYGAREIVKSCTQANAPPTQSTFSGRFSQSCPFSTQEKPLPPLPKFGQSSFKENAQLPPQFGQSSITATPLATATFTPSSVEPTRNNPFMSDAPSLPPPPPKSNLWGSKTGGSAFQASSSFPVSTQSKPGGSVFQASASFPVSTQSKPGGSVFQASASFPVSTQSKHSGSAFQASASLPVSTQPAGPSFAFLNSKPTHAPPQYTAFRAECKSQKSSPAYDFKVHSPPSSPILAAPADSNVDDLCNAVSRLKIMRPVAPIPQKNSGTSKKVRFSDVSFMNAILADFLGEPVGHRIDPQLLSAPTAPTCSSTAATPSSTAGLPALTISTPTVTVPVPTSTAAVSASIAALPAPALSSSTAVAPVPTLSASSACPAAVPVSSSVPSPPAAQAQQSGPPAPVIPSALRLNARITDASPSHSPELTPPTSEPPTEATSETPSETPSCPREKLS